MPEKTRSEFTLEAIKILIWPALIISATLWLGPDLKNILITRTWKLGMLEVGDRISTLGDSFKVELLAQKSYLDDILANPTDIDRVKNNARKAIESIENAEKGIKKEVQNIQESLPQSSISEGDTPPSTVDNKGAASQHPTTANGWEALGFEYLLNKNVKLSIEAFSQSEKIMPDLHNVSEIRRLLIKNRVELENKESPMWKEIYKTIITRYSWGMPLDARENMQKHISK